jgi:hypothetical protein
VAGLSEDCPHPWATTAALPNGCGVASLLPLVVRLSWVGVQQRAGQFRARAGSLSPLPRTPPPTTERSDCMEAKDPDGFQCTKGGSGKRSCGKLSGKNGSCLARLALPYCFRLPKNRLDSNCATSGRARNAHDIPHARPEQCGAQRRQHRKLAGTQIGFVGIH